MKQSHRISDNDNCQILAPITFSRYESHECSQSIPTTVGLETGQIVYTNPRLILSAVCRTDYHACAKSKKSPSNTPGAIRASAGKDAKESRARPPRITTPVSATRSGKTSPELSPT